MSRPLNALDLELSPCGTPGCTHDACKLYLHSVCHPKQGTWAVFEKGKGGIIRVYCVRCKKLVVELELFNPLKHQLKT